MDEHVKKYSARVRERSRRHAAGRNELNKWALTTANALRAHTKQYAKAREIRRQQELLLKFTSKTIH